jgi:hypothetical protein
LELALDEHETAELRRIDAALQRAVQWLAGSLAAWQAAAHADACAVRSG